MIRQNTIEDEESPPINLLKDLIVQTTGSKENTKIQNSKTFNEPSNKILDANEGDDVKPYLVDMASVN